ncbi:MAG: glycosyltransferase family 1 protein [Clostridiales bacterium]|nr:glycosyltransferase family 1 protein [Clostridiales bacterium]
MMVLTVRYGKNGIANCVMNYISRLDPARVQCDLVCPNEPDMIARAQVELTGGHVFVLPGRNRHPLSYVVKLSRIIRERGIEIVHAHGNSATLAAEMIAAKRGGAKVRMPHSHNTTCNMKVADKLLRGIFYRTSTDNIACSCLAGEWLYPKRKYTVLNNAIDAEKFRFSKTAREETREKLGLAPEEFVFLHIGAFNEQKNQSFLLEAFQALLLKKPDSRLLLVGDGERRASCEARVEALGFRKQVSFLGLRDDIPALLSAADAFVLPSLHEGLPLTLVEAQCAGLPCVASDRVTRESALTNLVVFIPIERADIFATAMEAIQRTERGAASNAAIIRAAEAGYDVSQNAETLMAIYEKATRVGNQ